MQALCKKYYFLPFRENLVRPRSACSRLFDSGTLKVFTADSEVVFKL